MIGDPAKRKEYDEVRKLGPVGAGFGLPASRAELVPGSGGGGAGGSPFAGGSFRVEDLGDLGDIFGGLFGRGENAGRAPPGVGRAHPAAPVPSGAQTSKPSSISPSPMR